MDEAYRRPAAKQLHEEKGHSCTKHPLTSMHVTCVNGKDIGQFDPIRPSQNYNKAGGIVRRVSRFLGLIQNSARYAEAFKTFFGADFSCERTADIVSNMRSRRFLGSMSLSSCTRYIRVETIFVARPFVPSLLLSLSVPRSNVVDLERSRMTILGRASWKCRSQRQPHRS